MYGPTYTGLPNPKPEHDPNNWYDCDSCMDYAPVMIATVDESGAIEGKECPDCRPILPAVAVMFGGLARVRCQTARCTCCADARLIVRYGGDNEEWWHADDETFAETYHVHVDSGSVCCDGPLDSWHVTRLCDLNWSYIFAGDASIGRERTPDRHDLWVQMVEQATPTYPYTEGSITVRRIGDRSSLLEAAWSEDTDEGHRGGTLRGCDDPWCDMGDRGQRDRFAEAMNY